MDHSRYLLQAYNDHANLRMALICRIMMLLMASVIALNLLHVFTIQRMIYPTLLFAMAIMFLPTLFYNILKWNHPAIRYLVLALAVFMAGVLYAFLSYHVIIMLVFPVVLACLYCDKGLVLYTTLLSIPTILAAHLVALQLRIVTDEPLVTLHGVLFYGVLPRELEFLAIAVICWSMAGRLQQLIYTLADKNNELYADQESLIYSLAEMIETQCQETGQHVKRVSEYTNVLCHALHMDDEECWLVSRAAMMHDVGKIMVPQELINKPGRLTSEEYDAVKQHVYYGKQLLEKSPGALLQISARIAYEHHEHYDGSGYNGMKGEAISLYARCVAIADVFDALVSARPYKAAWSPEAARQEILAQRGAYFDPQLVDLFDANFDAFLAVLARYPDPEAHPAARAVPA
jgi:HD-GYP domain-containing protein (c-di-GMP phosphodiesterase class II)